jgi:hypothetical protein
MIVSISWFMFESPCELMCREAVAGAEKGFASTERSGE